MQAGAVIVAAGMSSRMGDFKPMLQIGSLSVAQHVILSFQQVGIRQIAVVTGHNASALTEHLSEFDVTFLYNENYQSTQMFDSAKLGLAYMQTYCDRIFFTPVDVPLFTADTLCALMSVDAPLVTPFCAGRQGHPLLISSSLVDSILNDCGNGGLKGAISRTGVPMTHVEVDDPGVLHDADTPEEFQVLLKLYRNGCSASYPSDSEIEQLLTEAGTPEHIRAHCRAVAKKALLLASQIDQATDCALLRAACLLHDLVRADHKNHAATAADFLAVKGYPVLAEIVGQHHDLKERASIEAQLLYLADKLVQETREVTLQERFMASERKCTTPEALALWKRRYHDALRIAAYCRLPEDGNGGLQ